MGFTWTLQVSPGLEASALRYKLETTVPLNTYAQSVDRPQTRRNLSGSKNQLLDTVISIFSRFSPSTIGKAAEIHAGRAEFPEQRSAGRRQFPGINSGDDRKWVRKDGNAKGKATSR